MFYVKACLVSAKIFAISDVYFLFAPAFIDSYLLSNIVFSVCNTVFDCILYILIQVSSDTGYHCNSVLLDDVSPLTLNFILSVYSVHSDFPLPVLSFINFQGGCSIL